MQALIATTELDSVNIMLGTIGESPISSLTSDQSMVDVAIARGILLEVTKQVQEEGWDYNTEIQWVLTPDNTGTIYLPVNCIQIDVSKISSDPSILITSRGGKVYDRLNHTFTFTSPVTVDMIVLISFDDMPESSRHYITIRASRVFQQRVVGSDTLMGFTEKDEARARAALKKLDGDNSQYNILSGSYSVARTLYR